MAVRKVLKDNDPLLRKRSKEVKDINEEIITLLDDMLDTMEDYNGIGLAAPQIGVLKRVIVVKISDEGEPIELINPKIIKSKGQDRDVEGCLSIPGVYGEVTRAKEVIVEGLDREGKKRKIMGSGLLARALQHEIDHLNGVLFTDKVEKILES
ncbi:peptide deformylase [Anaerobranca californiensis DSM 14826]|jgi:peptide deformylase|uniref:Peptide deformylase n=1 Tax=Anaerobranca californiensis DSM 14826 TaxID=1120989 RepID=A0A1M6KR02_9FIRM|nr:peptide deformylase [Anaerobranca californiensis]SHJ61320.1 peptide deformylase [Anaerobranca californiensis DSM 14826]